MINEKDLQIEYKIDTGKAVDFVNDALVYCTCPMCQAEFTLTFEDEPEYHKWITEKYLNLRNKINGTGYNETIEFAKWVVERGIVGAHNRYNQFWFNLQDGSNPVKSMEEIFKLFKKR